MRLFPVTKFISYFWFCYLNHTLKMKTFYPLILPLFIFINCSVQGQGETKANLTARLIDPRIRRQFPQIIQPEAVAAQEIRCRACNLLFLSLNFLTTTTCISLLMALITIPLTVVMQLMGK